MKSNYYLMVDTETTNSLEHPLVYDIGLQVFNKKTGKVVEEKSLVVKDIYDNKDLMSSAYYIAKLPKYEKDLELGKRTKVSIYQAKRIFRQLIADYNIKVVIAHNIKFDYIALDTTLAYLTKSKNRHFMPIGLNLFDTQMWVRKCLANTEDYKKFCLENGYLTEKYKRPQITAEVVYRYLTNNVDFIEEHQGLADCDIERQIFMWCKKQGVSVKAWGNTWLPAWCYWWYGMIAKSSL